MSRRWVTKSKTMHRRVFFSEDSSAVNSYPFPLLQSINDMLKDFHFRHEDANLPVIA